MNLNSKLSFKKATLIEDVTSSKRFRVIATSDDPLNEFRTGSPFTPHGQVIKYDMQDFARGFDYAVTEETLRPFSIYEDVIYLMESDVLNYSLVLEEELN